MDIYDQRLYFTFGSRKSSDPILRHKMQLFNHELNFNDMIKCELNSKKCYYIKFTGKEGMQLKGIPSEIEVKI